MTTLGEVADIVRSADDLALVCHHHPDGDALGSMLAMHLLCAANGKRSVASWPEPFSVGPHYEFLPGLDRCTPPKEFPTHPKVVVTFDLGSRERMGELGAVLDTAETVVVLDHHPDNQHFGTHNLVLTDLAATAVIVRRLAEELGWSLTRDAALCLYVGLVTDTGRFQYPNTTPDVFHLAEELANYDLSIAEVTLELFEKHRFQYVQMMSMALARAELDVEHRLVTAHLTQDDLDRYGVTFDETEGFIDHLRGCAEAEVACVLKEAPGEGLRVSLRSTGEVDVGDVAAQLGGGGHSFMSGFVSDVGIAETVDRIRDLLPVPVS
ncbi:MAG: DHH family phosphoesterase [Acidimicrobiales bacterium]